MAWRKRGLSPRLVPHLRVVREGRVGSIPDEVPAIRWREPVGCNGGHGGMRIAPLYTERSMQGTIPSLAQFSGPGMTLLLDDRHHPPGEPEGFL